MITTPKDHRAGQIPWPIWPLLGWGIGLTMHFVFTYVVKYDEKEAVEKEYEKLLKERH